MPDRCLLWCSIADAGTTVATARAAVQFLVASNPCLETTAQSGAGTVRAVCATALNARAANVILRKTAPACAEITRAAIAVVRASRAAGETHRGRGGTGSRGSGRGDAGAVLAELARGTGIPAGATVVDVGL